MKGWSTVAATACLFVMAAFGFAPSSEPTNVQAARIPAFLTVERSTVLFNVLYHYGRVTPARNGAYGPNVTAPRKSWYLEYQRAGGLDVIAGVMHHDVAQIRTGLRMFHFGFGREAKDGAFPGSAWPFHGTAMFLAEAAPALLVLKGSGEASGLAREIQWQTSRARTAAHYMVKRVGGAGKIDDRTKNHRYYEAALALQGTAALSGDTTLRRSASVYAEEGMRMERPDGTMPESGGHDSGYQALGLIDATRYLTLLGSGSRATRLFTVIRKGEAWELKRVRGNGTINQRGDTRTTGCHERDPLGKCKTAFYATIFNALARWAVITGNFRFERAAYKVWLQNWALVPGDILPPPGLWTKPRSVRAGTLLVVWGTRFQPLEKVTILWDKTPMATATTDQIGSFGGHSSVYNATFRVPPSSSGKHIVVAQGNFGTVRRTTVSVAS